MLFLKWHYIPRKQPHIFTGNSIWLAAWHDALLKQWQPDVLIMKPITLSCFTASVRWMKKHHVK
jgi:hypothetical protein